MNTAHLISINWPPEKADLISYKILASQISEVLTFLGERAKCVFTDVIYHFYNNTAGLLSLTPFYRGQK